MILIEAFAKISDSGEADHDLPREPFRGRVHPGEAAAVARPFCDDGGSQAAATARAVRHDGRGDKARRLRRRRESS